MPTRNDDAVAFTRLHVPGRPIVLINVWDAVSARAVASLPSCKALATPSAGIANAIGLVDDDLTLEANLYTLKSIANVAHEFNKPLTVDMQDGYGERLEECIAAIINLGAVGLNLEDCDKDAAKMYSIDEAVARIKRVKTAAAAAGVPDLHINARSDALLHGGTVDEAIARGNAYLAAGAATVFVWGGPKRGGTSGSEIIQLCKAFNGKLNASMKLDPGFLTLQDLTEIGVARVSIGPGMQRMAMSFVGKEAERILKDS